MVLTCSLYNNFVCRDRVTSLHLQVGGWSEVYEGLAFASVRDEGHEVPLFQPSRAFRMLVSFLAGNWEAIGQILKVLACRGLLMCSVMPS